MCEARVIHIITGDEHHTAGHEFQLAVRVVDCTVIPDPGPSLRSAWHCGAPCEYDMIRIHVHVASVHSWEIVVFWSMRVWSTCHSP